MPSRDYPPGEHVPGTVYKVVRLIGVGGMGTVYDVEDTTIGKRYVLKTLHPKLGAREDLARRVQNEARTLARLNHPNIVEVITAGVTSDDLRLPYYVMERLNGQSLRVILEKKGRLELAHAYHIGIDLLDALDHAHDKGLIHRDVKPDNIFLHRTVAGVTLTKLLDFGIVSVLDDGSRETAGRFLGTLRYAAPEQLQGDKPTAKMDLYAAALVIYEIVAGRGPFDDQGDASHIGSAHVSKPPPRVSHFVPVPREFDSLLMAALSKDPSARPRDAFSFAASLRNLKRRLQTAEERETTENRATAPAVLAPESSLPAVEPWGSRGPSSSLPPPRPPQTTLHGMPAPTLEPAPAPSPQLPPTATIPDAVDRTAATRSLATDVDPKPQNETSVLVSVEAARTSQSADMLTLPDGTGPSPLPSPLNWPPSKDPIRSDGPQVRPVLASIPGRPARALLWGVVAVVAVGALVASARHKAPISVTASGPVREATVDQATPPPPSAPVVIAPAPTLSPPAFDDLAPSAAAAAVRAHPSSSALSIASPAPTKKPKAATPHFAVDRPGPGFEFRPSSARQKSGRTSGSRFAVGSRRGETRLFPGASPRTRKAAPAALRVPPNGADLTEGGASPSGAAFGAPAAWDLRATNGEDSGA